MGRKQSQIPGTERAVDEEIEAAIETLQTAKTKRAEAKVEVDAAVEEIVELMASRGLTEYVSAELEAKVTVADQTKLSLSKFAMRESSLDEAAE
jgi:ketol-acid reductoisomerase